GGGAATDPALCASLADPGNLGSWSAGYLRPLGDDRGTLLFAARSIDGQGHAGAEQSFEIGPDMRFKRYDGKPIAEPKSPGAAEGYDVTSDDASIILHWDK